jgi:peptidoglycan/LPS O-acetylase OafA/YrhL
MLDVYRFILALCVMEEHLLAWSPIWLAHEAVFSFYVLSGFLMTFILNQNYGFEKGGFVRFVTNRALRLLPIYYIVIGLTALYIGLVGPLDQLNGGVTLPNGAAEWVANLGILGLSGFSGNTAHRLTPVAWSLSVECFSYGLLGLYFAKTRARLLTMLAVGVAIAVIQVVGAFDQPDYGFHDHYRVTQAGFIPFAVGGLSYFFRRSRLFAFSRAKFSILCVLLIANFGGGFFSEFHNYVSGLYVAIALNACFVPMLFERGGTSWWQKMLGGVTYPLFLSHWVIGTLVIIYFPAIVTGSLAHLAVTATVTLLFSLLLYYGVDRQVQRVRVQIKNRRDRSAFLWWNSLHVGSER